MNRVFNIKGETVIVIMKNGSRVRLYPGKPLDLPDGGVSPDMVDQAKKGFLKIKKVGDSRVLGPLDGSDPVVPVDRKQPEAKPKKPDVAEDVKKLEVLLKEKAIPAPEEASPSSPAVQTVAPVLEAPSEPERQAEEPVRTEFEKEEVKPEEVGTVESVLDVPKPSILEQAAEAVGLLKSHEDTIKAEMKKMIKSGKDLDADGKPLVKALKKRMARIDPNIAINGEVRDKVFAELKEEK